MWFTRVSIQNPVFATMMMAALLVLGLFSYNRLPVEQFPDVSFPVVVVQTEYPGASPENVEEEVTRKVEESVNTISGIKTLSSRSYESQSVVIVDELGFHHATSVAELLADRGCTVEVITNGMVVGQDLGITLDMENWWMRAGAKGIVQSTDLVPMGFAGGELTPTAAPDVIVSGMPTTGFANRAIAFDDKGHVFIGVGGGGNTCLDRSGKEPKIANPCTELATRGGIWRYDAAKTGQTFPADGQRFALQNSQMVRVSFGPDVLALSFGVTYWDQLGWPDRFASAEATERQRQVVDHLVAEVFECVDRRRPPCARRAGDKHQTVPFGQWCSPSRGLWLVRVHSLRPALT